MPAPTLLYPQGSLVRTDQPGGGFSLRGVLDGPGNVFFVNSGGGVNVVGGGFSPNSALATIDYAVGLCTANQGDTIYVMPGHAEDVTAANGLDIDVAGITVVFLGSRATRGTVTVKTATTASIRVNAADVTVRGLRATAGTAQLLVKMLDVNADNFTLEDFELIGASTSTFLVSSFVNLATTKDGMILRRGLIRQGTDPNTTNAAVDTGGVYLVDSENVLIEDVEFRGNIETACIHNKTTGAANLWVRRCWGICALSNQVPFVLVSTATGGADRCSFITPAEAAVTEATLSGTFGAGFFNFESYFGNDGAGGQLAVASHGAAT